MTDDGPIALQLLLADRLAGLPADGLAAAVRGHHPDLAAATVELVPASPDQRPAAGPPAAFLGTVGWGRHAVKLIGCDGPMPYGPVEACVGPAPMPPPLKADAKQHASHLLLYYAGGEPDPVERYVAVAAVAGAAARFGGVAVLNEDARAAVPAVDLVPDAGEDILATLRGLPVPYLWGGFVKLDVGDATRPWARSYANHKVALPDLAKRLGGHHETSRTFRLFAALLGYLRQTGASFAAGDRIDLGDDGRLALRPPTDREWFLDSPGPLLVIEPADD